MSEAIRAMRIADLHPDIQGPAKKFPRMAVYKPWVLRVVRFISKFGLFTTKSLPGVRHRDVDLDSASVRVYESEQASSGVGVLWIHGGGMILGTNKMDDKMCSRYVTELGAVVCSVEYRLAPEHPYPAGLDDCYEVWTWMLEQADELGIDTSRIIIGGQSGGGCLAASLAQRILDRGGVQPRVQLLHCPMLDDRTGAQHELDVIEHVGWTNRNNRAAWSWYLNCDAGASTVPEGSVPARREDLDGLPPAWIGIGDVDLFYDESRIYAERLLGAGVPVITDFVADVPHGFEVFGDETDFVHEYFERHFDAARDLLAEKG